MRAALAHVGHGGVVGLDISIDDVGQEDAMVARVDVADRLTDELAQDSIDQQWNILRTSLDF